MELVLSGDFPAHARLDPSLAGNVERRLTALSRHQAIVRLWDRDYTLWGSDPRGISDRLGWLTVARDMRRRVPELETFCHQVTDDGLTAVVVLGMGGSSLTSEVLQSTFGSADGLPVTVLDSTHPDQVRAVEAAHDLRRTLFIVASKSGGTIETRCHFDYFWDRIQDGRNFAVITDAGSALDQLGQERTVRRIFRSPEDVGGRYSALSYFGLVPAALTGVDVGRLLDGAEQMSTACGPDVPSSTNPGAWLGALLGEAALHGRDKLTLLLPPRLRAFGAWVEQLVAESTGKSGRGIVPVIETEPGEPAWYGSDELFVAVGEDSDSITGAFDPAGHPVVRIPWSHDYALGAEFVRWEFAIAIAGHILGVNPFDQPDVQAAKDATAAVLAGGPSLPAGYGNTCVADLLAKYCEAGDYIAILAYLPRTPTTERLLESVRHNLRMLGMPVTVGFGPRYLHSTGQLHKGGPPSGQFIMVQPDVVEDLPIPGHPFTFGQLITAQASGDLAALHGRGRAVAVEDTEGIAIWATPLAVR